MQPSINRVMGSVEWALLGFLSIIWGGSFYFNEVALAELRPFTVVLGRVGLGAIALHLIVVLSGRRMPTSPVVWGQFFLMGALNNLLPFSLIVYGQTQIPGGLASILNASTPLWGVLLAHLLTTDEKMTGNRFAGVLIGLVGVVVMIGPDALGGIGLNALAQLAVIGASVSYAVAGIFGKRFRGIPPLLTATGQVTGTAVMMVPIALLVDQPWRLPMPGAATWGALLGLALLSTALGYLLYFRLLATAVATNLMLVTLLVPVSVLLLGVTILGEQLSADDFVGMACIGLGLAAIDGRPLALLRGHGRQPTVQSRR